MVLGRSCFNAFSSSSSKVDAESLISQPDTYTVIDNRCFKTSGLKIDSVIVGDCL